jgi:hypothetical protein
MFCFDYSSPAFGCKFGQNNKFTSLLCLTIICLHMHASYTHCREWTVTPVQDKIHILQYKIFILHNAVYPALLLKPAAHVLLSSQASQLQAAAAQVTAAARAACGAQLAVCCGARSACSVLQPTYCI